MAAEGRLAGTGKLATYAAMFIVFLVYEGFFILPDAIVVPFPGQFRIADAVVMAYFLSFSAFLVRTLRVMRESAEASLLMLTACLLFFATVMMAQVSFGQEIMSGLMYIRHSFHYLLFFMFCSLLETETEMRRFIRIATCFVALLAVLAITQKYFPSLPIFNFRSIRVKQYLDENNIRLGDYRLFFPAIEFAFLTYFLNLADLLHSRKPGWFVFKLVFLCLMIYVVMANATRSYVITMALVTLVAFITGRRRILKFTGIALVVLAISGQALSLAITQEGIGLFEQNKLSRIIKLSVNTKEGSIQGRMFQNRMYWDNFFKSPLLGVGTLRYNPNLGESYRKYGFYNNNDLGYVKILAEYGMVGLLWVFWFYAYVFRRTRTVIRGAAVSGDISYPGVVARGIQLFFLFVAVSMVTIPHFIEGDRIIPIVLAVVFLETARRVLPAKAEQETDK
jgi:hypothetical protein